MLQQQLVRRVGSLPDWLAARLDSADAAPLDQWFDRSLQAASLGKVFDGN